MGLDFNIGSPVYIVIRVDCACADASGFVAIEEDLRVQSSPGNVFCVGDMASSVKHPRPKAGVYAVRQGPPLSDNIRRSASVQHFVVKGCKCDLPIRSQTRCGQMLVISQYSSCK